MSNIYIQEPPTEGKICLETTAGDIDIELWSREAPKACRNFVQLCMEGYYDGTIFHRLVKGFIVQGGDPTGTGAGGNSIWGKPFKDEFHSRLRFMRRGLVAMANAGRDDNGSQFFFTLGATPELQNKHTIFAKVGGNTIYNMLKLEEGLTDENEKPLYPHKIVKTRILSNPFNDIVPRESIKKVKDEKKDSKNKSKAAATKNYKLLSFGEEAEEDEEEVDEVNKKYSGKSKSSHDLANDPKLSSQPAVDTFKTKKQKPRDSDKSDSGSGESDSEPGSERKSSKKRQKKESDNSDDDDEKGKQKGKDIQSVRDKLKRKEEKSLTKEKDHRSKSTEKKTESVSKKDDDDSEEEEYYLGKEEKMAQKRKVEELRKEYKELRKSMKHEEKVEEKEAAKASKEAEGKAAKLAAENNVIKEFMDEQEKYKKVKAKAPKKGEDREALTLAMLAKFKNKIETAKETFGDKELPPSTTTSKDSVKGEGGESDEEDSDDISWLARKLHYDNKDEVLAKDANMKNDDWFDIYDPRNTLAKRRREKGRNDTKEKKRAKINN